MVPKNRMYGINTADFAAALIIIVLSMTPVFSFYNLPSAGKTVHIYEGGKQVEKVELPHDGIYKAGNVVVQVSGGRVKVAKSDCPRRICVHTGWISGPAQTIVCVPNKVLIEIKNNGVAQEFDAVSY